MIMLVALHCGRSGCKCNLVYILEDNDGVLIAGISKLVMQTKKSLK